MRILQLPSHWPPLSHNSRGVPSGHSQSRSRDVLPPPQVAEHSDQQDHGEYSHFGGQASRIVLKRRSVTNQNYLPIEQGDSSLNSPSQPSSISSGLGHCSSPLVSFLTQVRSRGSVPPPQVTEQGPSAVQGVHSHSGSPLQVSHSSFGPQPQSGFSASPPGGQSHSR